MAVKVTSLQVHQRTSERPIASPEQQFRYESLNDYMHMMMKGGSFVTILEEHELYTMIQCKSRDWVSVHIVREV